jgi:hypothetical protein
MQNLIQNPLAKYLLAGTVKDGDTVIARKGKDGIDFSVKKRAEE